MSHGTGHMTHRATVLLCPDVLVAIIWD